MKRILPLVLMFACGTAVGWLARESPSPPPQEHNSLTLIFSGTITVRRETGDVLMLKPHAIWVDQQSQRCAPFPDCEAVWHVSLNGGQVKVACTEIKP